MMAKKKDIEYDKLMLATGAAPFFASDSRGGFCREFMLYRLCITPRRLKKR